jgi:hypothetical protein
MYYSSIARINQATISTIIAIMLSQSAMICLLLLLSALDGLLFMGALLALVIPFSPPLSTKRSGFEAPRGEQMGEIGLDVGDEIVCEGWAIF